MGLPTRMVICPRCQFEVHFPILTEAQEVVMRLMVGKEGLSMAQIADKLCLSVKTVESHRAAIYRRLHVKGLVGLVKWALRNGVIPLKERDADADVKENHPVV